MAKINVLDFEIANLIAAGEVVERPSSVLKELIENSIDSGANKIVAEIKKGGVALIRVTDNGSGIDKEDLPVALKRHATSKIQNKEDLDGILTLGFRGEALAAISSVSEVTIITRTADSEMGSMLTSEGGRVLDVSEVGAAEGTTVVVENLFFNVPARRKFLKKDSTEAMNVAALVEKVALSRPDISIQLLIDGEERFCTPGDGNLKNTIYSIYGKAFSEKMIPCDGTADGIKVHGYIGRSDNARKNRNLQNVFINGRFVKSLTVMTALEKAYTSYIAPECFPVAVLFLEMNPKSVDVNVHPAKLEVKFTNEQPVFESVYYTVKRALEEHEYRPEMSFGKENRGERTAIGAFTPIGEKTSGEQIAISAAPVKREALGDLGRSADLSRPLRAASSVGFSTAPSSRGGYNGPSEGFKKAADYQTMTPQRSVGVLESYSKSSPAKYDFPLEGTKIEDTPVPPAFSEEPVVNYKLCGEAFDCYLMVEHEGALLVIDKHAAHERVIFEELKADRAKDGRVASQTLLLPITALMSCDEICAAEEHREDLLAVGFDFTSGEKSCDITAIPDAISASDAETLFVKMCEELALGKGNPEITESIRREKALYQIACKAAIKGGRHYDSSVIDWLVKKVLLLPDITVCPHGRPIAYRLTKSELDRQFDRIK